LVGVKVGKGEMPKDKTRGRRRTNAEPRKAEESGPKRKSLWDEETANEGRAKETQDRRQKVERIFQKTSPGIEGEKISRLRISHTKGDCD